MASARPWGKTIATTDQAARANTAAQATGAKTATALSGRANPDAPQDAESKSVPALLAVAANLPAARYHKPARTINNPPVARRDFRFSKTYHVVPTPTTSFPRRREPRASSRHTALDSGFRRNDGTGKPKDPAVARTFCPCPSRPGGVDMECPCRPAPYRASDVHAPATAFARLNLPNRNAIPSAYQIDDTAPLRPPFTHRYHF